MIFFWYVLYTHTEHTHTHTHTHQAALAQLERPFIQTSPKKNPNSNGKIQAAASLFRGRQPLNNLSKKKKQAALAQFKRQLTVAEGARHAELDLAARLLRASHETVARCVPYMS
jgi:hypothetical protein